VVLVLGVESLDFESRFVIRVYDGDRPCTKRSIIPRMAETCVKTRITVSFLFVLVSVISDSCAKPTVIRGSKLKTKNQRPTPDILRQCAYSELIQAVRQPGGVSLKAMAESIRLSTLGRFEHLQR